MVYALIVTTCLVASFVPGTEFSAFHKCTTGLSSKLTYQSYTDCAAAMYTATPPPTEFVNFYFCAPRNELLNRFLSIRPGEPT